MRRTYLLPLLAAGALLVTACGDDSNPTTDTTTTDTTADVLEDTSTPEDTTATDSMVADSEETDTLVEEDTTETDTMVEDTTETDTMVEDTTETDTTVEDTTETDTTVEDTTETDTTETDTTVTGDCASELFFSEYVEGSSNNKALEIANFTGMPIDLGEYEIINLGNVDDNVTWADNGESTPLPHVIIESGDVFVICNSQSNDEIKAVCDLQISGGSTSLIYGLPVFFNGNDARALAKGGTRLDDIGAENMVLTNGKWAAGGVDDATAEHTLVRKSSVMAPTTDWLNTAASDWTVLDQDVVTDLGMHTYDGTCTGITAAADIVVNEIVVAPATGEQWIELYNNTDAAVDLEGWTLDDNASADESSTLTFATGTTIPANGFLVLTGNTDFTFDLGAADHLVLKDADGVFADAVTWIDGYVPTDSSYGRLPDGTGMFATLTLPTPGAANQTCGDAVCADEESCGSCADDCGVCADVALNEVLWDSADANPAFVELYNNDSVEADISGWMLIAGDDSAYVFPASTTIAAGAYLVIDESTHGLTLTATDSLSLADDIGYVLETATWDSLAAGDSWGRFPNVTGGFMTLTAPSPGAENVVESTGHCASDLFFSEYIEGGSYRKVLEIANFTGAAVDLSAYEILEGSAGGAYDDSPIVLSGTLADGDVYVICDSQAASDPTIFDGTACDLTQTLYFNGDDARALAKIPSGGGDPIVLDVIGLTDNVDPGGGWEVAGVFEGTKDHTLRRIGTVNGPNADWASSQASEWEVLDKDTMDGVGSHTYTATCQ